MARPLPDALERRNLLWTEQKRPVDHAAYAERYLEAGRKSDALDFIDRIADAARKDALRAKVRDEALRDGNYFLLNRLEASAPLGEQAWRDALKRAREAGKLRYALKIAKKLGDAAEVEALERDLGIVRPAVTPPAATDGPAPIPPGVGGSASPEGDGAPAPDGDAPPAE